MVAQAYPWLLRAGRAGRGKSSSIWLRNESLNKASCPSPARSLTKETSTADSLPPPTEPITSSGSCPSWQPSWDHGHLPSQRQPRSQLNTHACPVRRAKGSAIPGLPALLLSFHHQIFLQLCKGLTCPGGGQNKQGEKACPVCRVSFVPLPGTGWKHWSLKGTGPPPLAFAMETSWSHVISDRKWGERGLLPTPPPYPTWKEIRDCCHTGGTMQGEAAGRHCISNITTHRKSWILITHPQRA